MARGFNKVVLIGNVARDPDVRVTQMTMQKVSRFTLAVNREWKDKNTGEKKSEADFISCNAWGSLADVVEKWCRKGKQLLVEGRLQVRKYQGKDGTDKWDTSVLVEELMLMGGGKDNAENGGGATILMQKPVAQAQANEPDFPLDISGADIADIPF